MIKIGLTGGVATGKSTVAKILKEKGAELISSDELAHRAMAPGGFAYDGVISEFGPEIILSDGKINRRRLGEIVFNDESARKRLERIIHPIVLKEIKQGLEDYSKQRTRIVIIEVPLLFEVGWMDLFDYIWVVYAPYERQLQRLMERDQISEIEAIKRIIAQMPLEEKKKLADAVIENNDGLDVLEKQVTTLLRTME